MRCLRNSKRTPFSAEAHAGIMRHLNRSPIHREGAAGTRRLLRRPLSRPDVPQPPFNAKARLAQGGFFAAPPFSAKAYSGIARRAGRSPSEARKLPEQKPRSPRGVRAYGKPLRANPWEWREATSPAGSSGGSAEGASEGRQPLTGPHLPPPEAAQTTNNKGLRACRAQKPPLKGQARLYSL